MARHSIRHAEAQTIATFFGESTQQLRAELAGNPLANKLKSRVSRWAARIVNRTVPAKAAKTT